MSTACLFDFFFRLTIWNVNSVIKKIQEDDNKF